MNAKKHGRILDLLKILFLETSRARPMAMPDLLRRMEEAGAPCERKAVYRYIKALNEHEIAVRYTPGEGGGYWFAGGWLDGTEPDKEE